MPLTREQWLDHVHGHLDKIASGAEMCARHASQLPLKPGFYSLAEDDMRRCEAVLRKALADVGAALRAYLDKETET